MPEERFEPGVDELRAALGVGEEERLECWLLLDRSGSVLFDRDELQEVDLAWHFASFDSERDRIGILGFCGFGDYVTLFEFKTPLKEADRAMLLMANSGGGGTPTAEAEPGTRGVRVSRPGPQHQLPAGHERLVSAAAEAVLGLGDAAATALERTLDASDPHLARLRTTCGCAASGCTRTVTIC